MSDAPDAGLGDLLDELLEPVGQLARELSPRVENVEALTVTPERGENVSATIAIPAPRAKRGGQTPVRYRALAPCPRCVSEDGLRPDDGCSECGGRGRVEVDQHLNVTFPAGTSHGDELRVRGQGNAGRGGGPPGDLLLFVLLLPKRRQAGLRSLRSSSDYD